MISIKSEREIELMKKAGNIVYKTHQYLKPYLKPGITTKKLDELAEAYIRSLGATPSFKESEGFPATICTSINDEVVHGIPSGRKLREGDIISIDIGACWQGYHGDSAWSYGIGKIKEEQAYLLKHTEQSLYEGLKQVKAGNRLGDIGNAIEQYAVEYKLGVIRELVGHGIGNKVHEKPDVPNYGKPDTGPLLKEGMTIAIEPMLNLGSRRVSMLDDDWTIVTEDGYPSAHFEHTVLVTKDGYLILTGE
ncbi:MAG: type I methionyl aminopeptidase [Bacilli bacterium]|nr:type I methionyl aminopeptidase [Bacilli bacterium]MDD4053394.1 type I methionyl aminopeptidase [Bacilli bacterium]MDD4410959.1 type I methionyl aminopeptidase [Bacilli bacterium]